MLGWTTSAPAPDAARFTTPLDWKRERIALRLAKSFEHGHTVSVANIGYALEGGSLGSFAALVPEIAKHYGELTGHQMKTVVIVDRGVGYYRTPFRGRGCRVKAAGAPACCKFPHIIMMDDFEAGKFLKFGTATLAIVVQHGGVLGNNPWRLMDLGRALATSRLEAVLVVTDDPTPPGDVQFAYRYFIQLKKTVGYTDM